MNVRTGKWDRATPAGEAPSPRAAHAAAAVGSMVVVQVSTQYLIRPDAGQSRQSAAVVRNAKDTFKQSGTCAKPVMRLLRK